MKIVIRLTSHDARVFAALWPADAFYCLPIEVISEERQRSSGTSGWADRIATSATWQG